MKDIICWWSGGITSAVACKLAIDLYGKERCRSIFIDTFNEHEDTYRFKLDCERWYGLEIESISAIGNEYKSIKDVWYKYKSLNVAHGAICSSVLKRDLRLKWQKENEYSLQVFVFDIDEPKRAKSMTMNYPNAKAIYPLLLHGMSKKACLELVDSENIKIPVAYELGFHNNNCLGSKKDEGGCVQGGIGYWQKMQRDFPLKFESMAKVEHDLTNMSGKPVTMNKDQSKNAKESGMFQVFLLPHPDYPNHKSLSDMEGREPKPLMECSGFGCAVNDLLPKNPTQAEINFE